MKKLLFILSVFFLASCGSTETSEVITSKDSVSSFENPEETEEIAHSCCTETCDDSHSEPAGPYSNPFFIYGSDFGNFFQTMYNQGKFEDMLAFTSSTSIEKFGKGAILNFYKNELEFGYDIGKHPFSSGTHGDTIMLNYQANIMATNKIIRINVFVENDSSKVVLPDDLMNNL